MDRINKTYLSSLFCVILNILGVCDENRECLLKHVESTENLLLDSQI